MQDTHQEFKYKSHEVDLPKDLDPDPDPDPDLDLDLDPYQAPSEG